MKRVRSTWMRRLIDAQAPRLARTYRRARDAYHAPRFRPEPTGLGFSILRGSEFANRLVGAELHAFNECLGGADLFVDVGANVGYFTLLSSRSGVPTLAIEPSPLNLRHLYENLRLAAGTGVVEILPVAISDTVGVVDLLGSGQAASLRFGWGDITSNYRTPVPATTLDLILSGRGGRLVIKVDVEGNENAVLRGASATLRRVPPPTWLVEHGPGVSEDYAEFFEEFWINDYKVTALPEAEGGTPYLVDAGTVAGWAQMQVAPELMFLCEPGLSTSQPKYIA